MALGVVLAMAVATGGLILYPRPPRSLSQTEQVLVGTWDFQVPQGQPKLTTLVFEVDREFRLGDGTVVGRWSVIGSELTLQHRLTSYRGMVHAILERANLEDDYELIVDPAGNRLTIKHPGGYEAVLTRSK